LFNAFGIQAMVSFSAFGGGVAVGGTAVGGATVGLGLHPPRTIVSITVIAISMYRYFFISFPPYFVVDRNSFGFPKGNPIECESCLITSFLRQALQRVYQKLRPVQLDFGSLKSTLFGDMPVRFLAPLVHRHLTKTSEVWLAEVLTAQVEKLSGFSPEVAPAYSITQTQPFCIPFTPQMLVGFPLFHRGVFPYLLAPNQVGNDSK
jgi:hypothetical protein